MKSKIILAGLLFLQLFSSHVSIANEGHSSQMIELMREPKYSNQFLIGLSTNTPIDKTSDNYEQGAVTAQLEYTSFLLDNWILGFGGGYQNLNNKITGKSLAVAKIYQRSRKLYRLYHPVYYSLGFEISYLFPSTAQDLVPELEEGFSTEFGVGLINSLIFRFDTTSIASLNVNAWRGTGSRKIQAVEIGLMIGKSI